MSTPAVSNFSIFQELQTFRHDRRADLQQLGDALKSGDLDAAKQAYDALVQLGQNGPYANSEPFSRPDRAQAFDALGQALQSGDLAGAQAAFAKLQSSGGHHHHHHGQDSTSGSPAVVVSLDGGPQTDGTESVYQQLRDFRQERKADVSQLGQALQSGDLTAAQQEYDALVQLGQNGPFKSGDPFQRADREKDFEAIGKALQSGDLAGAQQAFAALAATFGDHNSQGTNVVPKVIINILPDTPPGPTGPPTPSPVGTTAPPNPAGTTAPPAPAPGPTGPPTPAPVGTTAPPAPGPGTNAAPPEFVINFNGSQGGANPEVVINVGGGSGSSTSEEIQINFGDGSGSAGHLTIDVAPGQNGAGEQISISSQGVSNYQLVLNLTEAQASQSGSQLSLQA
jgi:hypothetical protein